MLNKDFSVCNGMYVVVKKSGVCGRLRRKRKDLIIGPRQNRGTIMSANNEITAVTNGGETTRSAGGGVSSSGGGWGGAVARGEAGNRGGAVSAGSGGWGACGSTDPVNCVMYRMRCGPLVGLF